MDASNVTADASTTDLGASADAGKGANDGGALDVQAPDHGLAPSGENDDLEGGRCNLAGRRDLSGSALFGLLLVALLMRRRRRIHR